MEPKRETILIVEGDPVSRERLLEQVRAAGYEASATDSAEEAFEVAKNVGFDLLLLDANLSRLDCCQVLTDIKGASATSAVRVILLSSGGALERSRGLDMGADDVISRPWDALELLARIRAQLRAKRAADDLREKTTIAEEGQQIAHTAFEALAVTEKMTRDAFTLDRALRIGVGAVFAIAVVMAIIFFVSSHRAEKQNQLATAAIVRLEGSLSRQGDLLAQTKKLHAQGDASAIPAAKEQLQQQADQLRAKMADASAAEVNSLQRQLDQTTARLKRVEQGSDAGRNFIPADVSSVCLLHVSVGFREKASGKRLRFAGINPQGEALHDSEGHPIFTTEGQGPEVRVEVFGTGFLAAGGGRVVTNRHIAQPWWADEDLSSLIGQGIQPEIATLRAYFPGIPHSFPAEIQEISKEVDLASMRVDLGGAPLPVLDLDANKKAAASGEPIVLMGYATGLAALLARTDEATAQKIVAGNGGDPSAIVEELARRKLIRPLITQGHIGDVLPDKIVFDAQTTSGGSGGPLFNADGKVIGVTYAVLKDFGGSNLGIPIRYSEPLLSH
jgi:DNA-binding response OmpR family regulator/S1-C subfamily serine protease